MLPRHPLVTFDVVTGAGSSGRTDPFATWDLGNGSSVELTTARVSNTVAPASCGAEVGVGNVWVAADGRLSLAADGQALDIPVRVSGSFAVPDIAPASWLREGRARLAAGDRVAPLPGPLRDFARSSPCFRGG